MKDKFKTLAVTGQSSIQMKSAYKLLSAMLIFWVRDFSKFCIHIQTDIQNNMYMNLDMRIYL